MVAGDPERMVVAVYLGVAGEAISAETLADVRQQGANRDTVEAEDRESVERHAIDELQIRLVHALDAASADWCESLLAGANLADALERAGAGFDFAAWLAMALRESWLKGVTVLRD